MKKVYIYSLGALLLTSILSLGSCKNQADDDLTRRTEQSVNQGTPVVFTFDMESLPEQDARALTIESQTVNGKNAGLKQKWDPDDTETIYLLFRQGVTREVVKTTLKIGEYNASSKRYEGKFEAMPTKINLAAGGVTVAGVMGVTGLEDTGEATIASTNFFAEADRFVTLPMYFVERPVKSDGTKYVADMTLHFFGSVVGVNVSNVGGNMTYSPHEVTFKTEGFTTEGTMNILNASEANSATGAAEVLPTWTTTQTATTEQRIRFDHGDIEVGEKKTLFFWVHPSSYSGDKPLELEMRTDGFDKELGATAPEITKTYNMKALTQRRVHRIAQVLQAPKGDLIISEVYMGLADYNTIWEIYNPTEEAIDLTKYSMYCYEYNNGYPSDATWKSSLIDENGWYKTLLDNRTNTRMTGWKLPSHKSIVFYPHSTIFTDATAYKHRPGLTCIINYWSWGNGRNEQSKYGKAFRVPQYSRHALVKDGQIVDSFFYADGTAQYSIPPGNFMRKPGRNLPRQEMKVDIKNSDWAVRLATAKDDLGYRYGFYYDRNRDSDPKDGISDFYGNHWLEDATANLKRHSSDGSIGFNDNAIYNADYSQFAARSGGAARLDKNNLKLYTPPTWWTKARATAADKQ